MPVAIDKVEALISKTGQEWAQHWNTGDLEGLIQAFAPDAVYMPPHHAALHGRDAIREYLKTPLKHGINLTYEVTFIKHSGELAYDVGRYSVSQPRPEGGHRQDCGKYLTVWRRQADGQWKIVADTFSSDLPPGA